MDDKEPEHRPLIGRLAGLAAIAFFIPALVPGDSSKFFSNLSSQQIVDWAAHNGRAISFQAFGQAFGATVFALFIVLLVVHVGGRGIPATSRLHIRGRNDGGELDRSQHPIRAC